MADLQSVLKVIEPRLRRHRPLARAGQQLLFDIAGLLSGLRSLIMLDNAPGATPSLLQQVLEPVFELLPDFQGLILHLDGCCYIANSRQLLQRMCTLVQDTATWPQVISFSNCHAAVTPYNQFSSLQQQVGVLAAALQQTQEGGVHASSSKRTASGFCSVLDLGKVPGLPAMPTLNGLLLGYPAIYWVRDMQEAEAACRVLSTSVLRLYTVQAVCSCCGPSSQPLMAFTAPAAVAGVSVDAAVQHLLDCVKETAAQCCGNGCAVSPPGAWSVKLLEEAVGPRPVSL